ncbi:MAG: DUF6428 family protein [Flavobacteriales bacterium]
MNIVEFKNHLSNLESLNFVLPNGHSVPAHFHITEAGLTTKHFIDCGGTVRMEKHVNFQIWVAGDTDHRLSPKKLNTIIDIAEPLFGGTNMEIEVEYQTDTLGRYALQFVDGSFQLIAKQSDCLAKDKCGIPQEKQKLQLADLTTSSSESCCTPGSGCC